MEFLASLPVRERGLKYAVCMPWHGDTKSLPVRERGLKYTYSAAVLDEFSVAPRAGAWIEI